MMGAPANGTQPMNSTEPPLTKPAKASPHLDAECEREKIVRIPVKWVWHYGMLHSLRERLLQEQESEMTAVAQPIEAHSMSPADSATDEFDHEMALCLLAREHNALREVDAAIERIFAGTYGICEESGEPIPAGRLRVVPWTRYTKEAQGRREREGLDLPPGIPPLASIQGPDAEVLAEAEDPERDELQSREIARHQRLAELRNGGPDGKEESWQQPSAAPASSELPTLQKGKRSKRSSIRRPREAKS